ncbi:hypothetical protein D5086_013512 [Populus alba]|uniref:Uncharacterized protein n=1 Tax=Populus alba TaxID=43335 RepID=A0ACC4C586_POPAL
MWRGDALSTSEYGCVCVCDFLMESANEVISSVEQSLKTKLCLTPLQLEADSQAVALAMYKDGEQTRDSITANRVT